MTKVLLSPSMLAYRQMMTELVNEVCEENAVAVADPGCEDLVIPRTDVVELWIPGLLRPPKIEMLWPDLRLVDGRLDGIIQIHTSEYFGVIGVRIRLEDDQGHLLESDYALDNEEVENHWGYFASAPASTGMTIVVRAIAEDQLGALAIKTERVTV